MKGLLGRDLAPEWILLGICLLGICIGWLVVRWMRGLPLLPYRLRLRREGFQVVQVEGGNENAAKLTEAEALAYDMLTIANLAACPDFIQTNTAMEETSMIRDKTTKFATYLTANAAPIKTRFWNYVSRLKPDEEMPIGSPPSMLPAIRTVMNPQPDDTYQVTFPLYMSIFALAVFEPGSNGALKTSCARVALFDNYMLLQKALTETVYDKTTIEQWNVAPKEQSCASIQVAEGNLREALNLLRTRVQDVSGITFTLANLRDENLEFQKRFKEACTNALSDSCKQLANQEPILFPLLAEFEGVSSIGYEKEEDLNEVLDTIGKLYSILGCQNLSGVKFTFSVEADLGDIDAETLRMKLQTLSPYYISPDTMKYITDFLISPDDVQEDLLKTSDVFAKINTSVGGIQRLSGIAV